MSGHITGPVIGPEVQRRVRRPPTGAEGLKQPSTGTKKRATWASEIIVIYVLSDVMVSVL